MERIGGYAVEAKLGEGGMGTVYLARSRGGRAVAVKVAKPELAADPAFRARFRAEVAAARAVGGFHTAPVVDADPDAEHPWLATAYVPGPTLSALLAAGGPLAGPALRRLGAALAEALAAIHGCGLVHRDLKPGNIIMAADGPRVLDFGIARAVESTHLTATGASFGTPGYLAPEQAVGGEVTGAADVFALGAVLVAAAGGNAWGEGTPMSLMYRAVHEPPDLASVPAALRGAVASCLAKDPAARPSPAELLDLLAGEPSAPVRTPTVVVEPADAVPPAVAYADTEEAPRTPPPATPPRAVPAPSYPAPPAQAPSYPERPARAPSYPVPPARAPEPAGWTPSGRARANRSRVPVELREGVPPEVRGRVPVAYARAVAALERPGPVFLALDRNAAVAADGEGLLFEIHDAQAEFVWDEIDTIERSRSGRGGRLTIYVALDDGTTYTCEVNARRAARREAWISELDGVAAHYLEGWTPPRDDP